MSLLDTIKSLFFGEKSEKPIENIKTEEVSVEVIEPSPIVKEKPEPVAATKPETIETVSNLQIPEDSTLKRHFISALKAEIEASMPTRPTDSALRRHYDATVEAELAILLD